MDELHKSNRADHMAAPFRPEQLHDSQRENVERLIREKEKDGKMVKPC
jgi:hypothetical protein